MAHTGNTDPKVEPVVAETFGEAFEVEGAVQADLAVMEQPADLSPPRRETVPSHPLLRTLRNSAAALITSVGLAAVAEVPVAAAAPTKHHPTKHHKHHPPQWKSSKGHWGDKQVSVKPPTTPPIHTGPVPNMEPVTVTVGSVDSANNPLTASPDGIAIAEACTTPSKTGNTTVNSLFAYKGGAQALKACQQGSTLKVTEALPTFGPLGDAQHNTWTPINPTQTVSVGSKAVNLVFTNKETPLSVAGKWMRTVQYARGGSFIDAYVYAAGGTYQANTQTITDFTADVPLPAPGTVSLPNNETLTATLTVGAYDSQGREESMQFGYQSANAYSDTAQHLFAGDVEDGASFLAHSHNPSPALNLGDALTGSDVRFEIKYDPEYTDSSTPTQPAWLEYVNGQLVGGYTADNWKGKLNMAKYATVSVRVTSQSPTAPDTVPLISGEPGGCPGAAEIPYSVADSNAPAPPRLQPFTFEPGAVSAALSPDGKVLSVGGDAPGYTGHC